MKGEASEEVGPEPETEPETVAETEAGIEADTTALVDRGLERQALGEDWVKDTYGTGLRRHRQTTAVEGSTDQRKVMEDHRWTETRQDSSFRSQQTVKAVLNEKLASRSPSLGQALYSFFGSLLHRATRSLRSAYTG